MGTGRSLLKTLQVGPDDFGPGIVVFVRPVQKRPATLSATAMTDFGVNVVYALALVNPRREGRTKRRERSSTPYFNGPRRTTPWLRLARNGLLGGAPAGFCDGSRRANKD